MCPPLPWPPAHPPGRGSRFNLLPLPARGECRGRPRMTFQPCTSFFPLKGGLGHFAKFYLSYIPLGPSSSALGSSPPQPMGRRKFQVRGDEVRAFKFFFFHPCLSVSQKKKFHIPVPIRGNPSRSLTLTRNQKENSPRSPHPHTPLILADASSSPPHTCIHARTPEWWGSSRWRPHQGPCGGDSAMTCGPHLSRHCGGHCSHETSLKSWLDPALAQPWTNLKDEQRREGAGSHFALLLLWRPTKF